MGKKVTEAMSYEDDDRDFPELLDRGNKGKPSVKATIKNGRKTKRETRQLKDMSVGGLIFYALFWRVFVPNYPLIMTLAFVGTNVLWIVKRGI